MVELWYIEPFGTM
jgi:hypothetical protein